MAKEVNTSVPEDYATFVEEEGLSYAKLLQGAIEERADRYGYDLEGY